jgi:hypothetical protein
MDRMQSKVQEGTGPNFVPAMVDAFRPEYMHTANKWNSNECKEVA